MEVKMKRLEELLNDRGTSHIRPFFWMHGEDHEVLREEMEKIEECGIREVCLESRPHPDYCGPHWWSDVDLIMGEARKRNMRVWILDDDKFPTGHANGGFIEKHPELAKVYLAERHMDIIGPVTDNAVLIKPFLGKNSKLIKVLAVKTADTETTALDSSNIIDLTDKVHDGFVYFDLPEGHYRLFVLFTTMERGGREAYMNLIDSRSVRVLIDEVYEKHYERYREDFGKTFAGFFSDEPELGNTPGYDFHDSLGKPDVRLPWSEELHAELKLLWGEELGFNLPALWFDMGEKTIALRSEYMESVTKLVQRCFSGQLGEWCRDHGIEYIGHIIEDDNAHTRMGCSIGHYFREMKGQHMAGIDVVHHQITPGFKERIHQWIAWDTDGEFFHYGLAKLGSSCSHIDPVKKGRALCEIFGNYGWAEGVSLMKWLTNHMLVRGINEFTPHAFSPKFPDRDCPPHFYARGNNPQFKHFKLLMRYMNRIAHLTSDGVHVADAAVLYHGEAEWSTGRTMLFQKPVRKLMEAQLDCDIIPADIFTEEYTGVASGKLTINQESYGSLIIPYCQYIPRLAVDFVMDAAGKGLKVYVIDELPEADTCNRELPESFADMVEVVSLEKLAQTIKRNQATEISCPDYLPDLRFYCYRHGDERIYLFFNEDITNAVDTEIKLNAGDFPAMAEYHAKSNTADRYLIDSNTLKLHLEPGQMRIFLPLTDTKDAGKLPVCTDRQEIACDWKVSLCEAGGSTEFEEKMVIKAKEELPNLNGPKYYTGFSGTFRYEGSFTVNGLKDRRCRLYLRNVGDCAEITVNGKDAGILLASPDRIDLTGLLQEGENSLRIDVTNTLVWKMRDGVSTFAMLKPTGLLEKPVLEFYE